MNIIAQSSPEPKPLVSRYDRQSGVRQVEGGWVAIRNGRYVDTFKGKRAFLAATRAAGSTRRLA